MAESLYWIGRYVERAEQTARITDATFAHTLAMGSTPEAEARRLRYWETLLDIVGESAAFAASGTIADEDTVPSHVTFADENPNSIVNCIGHALANARTLRHQVATEMWEVLNRFHLDVQRPARRRRATAGPEHVALFCRSVVEFSQLYQGVTDSTMPREEGWYFLQAGKFLERAEKTARALDANYRLLVGAAATGDRRALADAAVDPQPWASVLRSLSAYESYYRVSSSGVSPAGVLELLLLSPVVPRSVRFAVAKVDAALQHITEVAPDYNGSERASQRGDAGEARRAIGRLHAELAYQRFDDIVDSGLHGHLVDLQRQCYRIGEHVESEFFSHRPLTAQEVMA
jgi:uncharacterized alpha-E superfamily protein